MQPRTLVINERSSTSALVLAVVFGVLTIAMEMKFFGSVKMPGHRAFEVSAIPATTSAFRRNGLSTVTYTVVGEQVLPTRSRAYSSTAFVSTICCVRPAAIDRRSLRNAR